MRKSPAIADGAEFNLQALCIDRSFDASGATLRPPNPSTIRRTATAKGCAVPRSFVLASERSAGGRPNHQWKRRREALVWTPRRSLHHRHFDLRPAPHWHPWICECSTVWGGSKAAACARAAPIQDADLLREARTGAPVL